VSVLVQAADCVKEHLDVRCSKNLLQVRLNADSEHNELLVYSEQLVQKLSAQCDFVKFDNVYYYKPDQIKYKYYKAKGYLKVDVCIVGLLKD